MTEIKENVAFWRLAMPVVAFLGFLTGLVVCADALHASTRLRIFVIEFFMWFLICILVAILLDEEDMIDAFEIALLILLVPALTVFSGGRLARTFSTIYYVMIAFACWGMAIDRKKGDRWGIVRQTIVTFWGASLSLLAVADVGVFRHERPFLSRATIFSLVDIRSLLTVAIVVLYCGAAVVRVAAMSRPNVKDIPAHDVEPIPASGSIFIAVLRPISIAVVFLVDVLWACANFVWKLLVETFAHLSRFARTVVDLVMDEILTWDEFTAVFRITAAALGHLFVLRITSLEAPSLLAYLRETPVSQGFPAVLGIGALALVIAVTLLLTWHLITEDWLDGEALRLRGTGTAFCCSMIMIALSASGLLLFFASKQQWLQIVGFDRIGPFTISMLVLLVGMLLYHAARKLSPRFA